jgi:hypothetical protein
MSLCLVCIVPCLYRHERIRSCIHPLLCLTVRIAHRNVWNWFYVAAIILFAFWCRHERVAWSWSLFQLVSFVGLIAELLVEAVDDDCHHSCVVHVI